MRTFSKHLHTMYACVRIFPYKLQKSFAHNVHTYASNLRQNNKHSSHCTAQRVACNSNNEIVWSCDRLATTCGNCRLEKHSTVKSMLSQHVTAINIKRKRQRQRQPQQQLPQPQPQPQRKITHFYKRHSPKGATCNLEILLASNSCNILFRMYGQLVGLQALQASQALQAKSVSNSKRCDSLLPTFFFAIEKTLQQHNNSTTAQLTTNAYI